MPLSYAKNKKHIYANRAKNIEKYVEYNKAYSKYYYHHNKEIENFYSYEKITKDFRRIGKIF